MIDVGNDREFGFLWTPPSHDLEAVFVPLLTASLPAGPRRQAIQLASFFRLPGETRNPAIQRALLEGLGDPDEGVRTAARGVAATELDLAGAEDDPERLRLVVAAVRGESAGREAILRAIGRNQRLARRPELMGAIHGLVHRPDSAAGLIPLLSWPAIRDAEVLSIALAAWPRLEPSQRVEAIKAVLARPALVGAAEPREAVMQLLRRGVTDPSAEVRERTLRGVSESPTLWLGKGVDTLLLASLADDTPSLRRLGLELAAPRFGFWLRQDSREYLKNLLIDQDREVRAAALDYRLAPQADPERPGPGTPGQGRWSPTPRSPSGPTPSCNCRDDPADVAPTPGSAGRGC